MTPKKIGILGGTFDPIHLGHLQLADYCRKSLSLDEVRFIPNKIPPLKNHSQATAQQRAEMVALAIANHPYFVLDPRELERETPSYALFTLQSLHSDFPTAEFYWLMGEDALVDFKKWYRWEEILSLCQLAVVSRQTTLEIAEDLIPGVIKVDMPYAAIASRVIRQDLPKHLQDLPESVRQYILDHKIYK